MTENVRNIIEDSTYLPRITGGGMVNVFNNFGPDIPVFVGDKGQVFICVDDLQGIFSHVREMTKSFAKKQSEQMAPQASYNVGEVSGMDTLMGKLADIEDAKHSIPSAV
jgi:hypothetical protein